MKLTNTQYKLLPNEPTNKLLSTMHGKLPYCMGDIDHEVLIEVYKALLSEGLEVDQEPFLWIYRTLNAWEYSDYKFSKQKPAGQSVVDIVPVYTHYKPQCKSLSSEVIDEELKTYGYMGQGTDEFHEGFLDGVRFAEKAYGIEVEQ